MEHALPAIRGLFCAAALATLPTLHTIARAESAPEYHSAVEANSKLEKFCHPTHLKTFQGHAECLQETSGQTFRFAEIFHASLFTKQGIAPQAQNYKEMIAAWQKTIAEKNLPTATQDLLNLKDYAHFCNDMMQENIFTPEAPLRFSYTTAYNIPKTCVDIAVHFSKAYGVALDNDEATRLGKHIESMYSYYKAHPVIPKELPPSHGRTFDT